MGRYSKGQGCWSQLNHGQVFFGHLYAWKAAVLACKAQSEHLPYQLETHALVDKVKLMIELLGENHMFIVISLPQDLVYIHGQLISE